jgi:uncharacterized membrane-anchored protein
MLKRLSNICGDAAHRRRRKRTAKFLILIGVVLLAVGIAWLVAERFGLGRLPGDIVIERDGFRLYIPVMTSVIVSVVVTLLLWLIGR